MVGDTLRQQNVNQSGSNTQSSQTLQATSPVLLTTSRCSQTPLALSNVIWDCARAFSDAVESTSRNGGAFRMLQDVTYRIVKFWSFWDLCADLRETSRAAGTTTPLRGRLQEHCKRLGARFSLQQFLHNLKACHLIIFLFVTVTRFATSKYGIQYLSLCTNGQSSHRWWSSMIGGAAGHAHRVNLEIYHFGGRCSEMMEQEGREPPTNTTPHHSWYSNEICETERFSLKERRHRLRRCDTTRHWRSTQLCGSMKSLGQTEWDQKLGKIECVFSLYHKMR
jgi:hypothetical protein